ncbi:hypothetical protein [Streptomyces malaysiensis]|uniref:hypothetical protein n=1 Tax=Streptomyces malaysiensis TaxID=92644 RepID=UPI00367C079C
MPHFTDWVEVHRAEIVADAYTNRRDWDNAVKVWAGWASVQPADAEEIDIPERETAPQKIKVFMPPTAVVDSMDRLVVDGISYTVRNDPKVWRRRANGHIYAKGWRVKR